MSALQTKNLSKHFGGVYAVNNLSVGFEAGQITGLVGPNGSGKSTLINLLTGLLPLDQGTVIVGQTTLKKIATPEIRTYGFARTFQEVRVFEQMTVLDNLLVVLTERNLWSAIFERHRAWHLAEAEKFLRQVDLWEKRRELARNLSYGQRKLLEVARALAAGGEIFLFDEPFAGLFPQMTGVVRNVIKNLRREDKTVVLVEHDMAIIRELCDRVLVMDEGKLLAQGRPENVLRRQEVVEAYLGE